MTSDWDISTLYLVFFHVTSRHVSIGGKYIRTPILETIPKTYSETLHWGMMTTKTMLPGVKSDQANNCEACEGMVLVGIT